MAIRDGRTTADIRIVIERCNRNVRSLCRSGSRDPVLREAAGRLGGFYSELPGQVEEFRPALMHLSETAIALSHAYKERDPRTGKLSTAGEQRARYKTDYDLIKSTLEATAWCWAVQTLSSQRCMLVEMSRILQSPGIDERMHEVAQRISERVGGLDLTRQAVQGAVEKYGLPPAESHQAKQFQQEVEQRMQRSRQRLGEAIREQLKDASRQDRSQDPREVQAADWQREHVELIAILFAHPQGAEILRAYEQSPVKGTELAVELVLQAATATDDFEKELEKQRDHIWRYSTIVVAGVLELGLLDILGFTEYAIALGQLLSRTDTERAVAAAQMVLLVAGVAVLLVAPASAAVAGTIIGMLEVGVAAVAIPVAYLREREQDLAAEASAFRPENARLAADTNYGDALLAAAGLVAAAMFVAGPLRELLTLRAVRGSRAGSLAQEAVVKEAAEDGIAGVAAPQKTQVEAPAASPEPPVRSLDRDPDSKGTDPVLTPSSRATSTTPLPEEAPAKSTPRSADRDGPLISERGTQGTGAIGHREALPSSDEILITSKTTVSRDLTKGELQKLMKRFLEALPQSVLNYVQRWKTIAIGLVEDSQGHQYLVYTVNSNHSAQAIKRAAEELGLVRWTATPRAGVRGTSGAPKDAEQLLLEAIAANPEYQLLAVIPSRNFCLDCISAIQAEERLVGVPLRDNAKR